MPLFFDSRAGIRAVPYHAKIPLSDRTENLDRFRRYSPEEDNNDSVAVLVCTDLASRGLDVPGVTAIVQLQFAGNGKIWCKSNVKACCMVSLTLPNS